MTKYDDLLINWYCHDGNIYLLLTDEFYNIAKERKPFSAVAPDMVEVLKMYIISDLEAVYRDYDYDDTYPGKLAAYMFSSLLDSYSLDCVVGGIIVRTAEPLYNEWLE